MEERSKLRRFTDKIYGGINLTWPGVFLYALGTAVLTSVFLIVPVFKNTSFSRMGEHDREPEKPLFLFFRKGRFYIGHLLDREWYTDNQ